MLHQAETTGLAHRLLCIIKGDLRLLYPRQCRTLTEIYFGNGNGVVLVNWPIQHLRREIS